MKIAFNPSTVAALITPPNNKDITFDLRGRNIFARGVKFCGTDTNTWRDIKINNVSIGSNILDLRNGSNTTLTNTNGIVTINSTWRPVVDNLTSDSTTSSLSANLGRILKALIDGKSNSGHTHDDRYLRLTGGWMSGDINFGDDNKISWGRNTDSASISFKNDGDGDADSYMSFVTSDNGNEYFRWSHSSGSTNTEWMALRSDGLRVGGTKVSLEGHSHNDLYYTKTEVNNKLNGKSDTSHTHDDRYLKLTGGIVNGIVGINATGVCGNSVLTVGPLDKRINTGIVDRYGTMLQIVGTGKKNEGGVIGFHNPSLYSAIIGFVRDTNETGFIFDTDVDRNSWYVKARAFKGLLLGNANSATLLLTARTINGTIFNGTSDITTIYWGATRTISLTGAVTGSVSTNGSDNITINTTYGTGNITNLDSRYLKRTGDTMSGTLSFSPTDSSDAAPKIYSTVSSGLTSLNFEVADDINDRFVFKINYLEETNATNRERFTIDWNNVISKAPITAPSFNGNATSATKLQTARLINGTNFDGSTNITTSYWGTTRTLTIGNSGKSVNGSANISWSLSEIGAASSDHNHDNRYVRKWTGVYGSANKFLKLAINNEKGWIRLEVSDSNNALSGGYGIYIIGWGWHDSNRTDTLFARCLYANDSRYTTALKVVRTSRNNYDFYFLFASGSSYPSYTINYSGSVISIDCTVTAIDTIPIATWTSSLSALQLNASQVDWSGITNKPSVFNPAAHTHTVFNNNLMIKGTNGVSDSASIHLGIGDSDTGFKWISDGKCLIYANNVAVGEWTSGGMNWFKNPTVNGNKVWNAGNDGSGSGLDADTLDGEHGIGYVRTRVNLYTTPNDIAKYVGGYIGMIINNNDSSYPEGKNSGWHHIISMNYNNSPDGPGNDGNYWCSQLINAAGSNKLYIRSRAGGNDITTGWTSWERLARITDNISSATQLQTARSIWGHSFNGTADVNGTIYINNSNSSEGAIRLNNNVNSNARISAIDSQVIFNTGAAIRFGGTSWDWNVWAGLKYDHTAKTIYLGLADSSIFTANSAQNGGLLRFPGITTVEACTIRIERANEINSYLGDLYLNHRGNGGSNGKTANIRMLNNGGGSLYLGGQLLFLAAEAHIGHSSGYTDPWSGLDSDFKFGGSLAATHIYSNGGFHKNGSNDSYVLLGGGGHSKITDLSVSNADTVDGYHASSLVKFYLSPMTGNAPADSAKSWFINTMPSASGAIVYNVPGSEKTIIAGKSSGTYGHMLQLNYDDTYLRILRYVYGSWKSSDWEKISAGYADLAGSATKVIVNLHTDNDVNYPLVWSNLANTNTVTENLLFKSWSDLYYNPKNKRLTVGGSIYAAHFYESSDKTLKKNIKSILSSTNIPKIREFDWKDTGEHSYGFIALELEELGYGCLVNEANGKKTVNYTATLALTVAKLLNLINIQNKKISNLTKELKALKYGRKKNS